MSRYLPKAKRTNARGERFCIGCEHYLPLSSFETWRNGKTESRCRFCRKQQTNAARNRRHQDDATWRRALAAMNRCSRELRQRRQAERRAFVVGAIERMRSQGFTLAELGELAGVRRCTLGDILAGRNAYIWGATEARITRVWRATMGLPETGKPQVKRNRPPHPALPLVRSRLERMAWLAELEAA